MNFVLIWFEHEKNPENINWGSEVPIVWGTEVLIG